MASEPERDARVPPLPEVGLDERKQREREFHDDRFATGSRSRLDAVYARDIAKDRYREVVLAAAPDRRVLEYGCGTGSLAFDLASVASEVIAIDISPVAVEMAQATAADAAIDATFAVMDAESLDLPDGSIDLICGSGILHHLDLDAATSELLRIMAPGAEAVFIEPLGHNPLINLVRWATPSARTDDEHPLLDSDVRELERRFGDVELEAYHLLGLIGMLPFVPRVVRSWLRRADCSIFRRWPGMRRFAWMVIVRFSLPSAAHPPGPST